MIDIFCISAGQFVSKKKNSVFSRKHRYLNYGLLKLASILGEHSYHPIVIHGLFESPASTLEICNRLGINDHNKPILLSIPSFFALDWAKEFSQLVKAFNPNRKIIVGGRWVVNSNEKWFKTYLDVDFVVPGLVGAEIVNIVDAYTQIESKGAKHSSSENPSANTVINYSYLHDRHLFQPSIEVSNGCGMGCAFCEERNLPLSKLKPAHIVAKEMESLAMDDGLIEMSPYLESSMFVATKAWAEDLFNERGARGVSTSWRVESRVDKLKVNNIQQLANAGLKVIDLGLESASHAQLIRMKKTDNPSKYLSAASDLIRASYDNGIWVKINILLYAGETNRSIDETMSWIDKNRNYLKGVSVGPVIVYGIDGESSRFVEEMSAYGASIATSEIFGVTCLNLSEEISYEHSLVLSQKISSEFMSAKDFYDLKSFSYFARDYKYSDFLSDIELGEHDEYSFGRD